jgi:hypothetical protein
VLFVARGNLAVVTPPLACATQHDKSHWLIIAESSINTKGNNMVVLHPAYFWDCPECGRENFSRGIVPEMSDTDRDELRNDYGVQPWEEGDFVMMPDSVECQYCHAVFATTHFKDA